MKKLVFFIFLSSSLLFGEVLSQEGESLTFYLGQTVTLSANNIERIAVGKSDVVEVVKVTEKEITLIGKSKGTTTLIWWDKFGEHSAYLKVYQEDMTEIKHRVDQLIKEVGISNIQTAALDSENKILLRGEARSIKDKEKFFLALGELKNKIVDLITVREEESNVEIEVQVLELSRDAAKTLGFTMPRTVTLSEQGSLPSSTSLKEVFKLVPFARSASFALTLDLLESQGKARILSRPRLVCRSGKEAELMVGGEVPILTTELTEYGAAQTNVEYKEYGITLKIKPTVVDEKKVDINLDVEISELQTADVLGAAASPTAKAYPITKRTFSTALSLENGATLSIGGLIKEKSTEDITKFPWLADVPVLGAFFRHKSVSSGGGEGQRGNAELYITLTPRIIFSPEEHKLTKIEDLPKKAPYPQEIAEHHRKANIPSELQGYIVDVHQKILENISYPSVLINTGWGAKLVLSLKVSASGEPKEVQIIKSSGYKTFDEEALKTAKNLFYPPFPPDIHLEEITVNVPIVYKSQK